MAAASDDRFTRKLRAMHKKQQSDGRCRNAFNDRHKATFRREKRGQQYHGDKCQRERVKDTKNFHKNS
nr:hypothetical protein [Salmonella enterica]